MPAGRLLRLARPVGRRAQATYTRVGKAVQPQGTPEGQVPEREVDPAPEDTAPEPTPTPTPNHPSEAPRAAEDGGAQQGGAQQDASAGEAKEAGPMEVLYMREPTVVPGKNHPPMPYTHYFDTYLMVNRLTDAGFGRGEAVTTMKAVRALLGDKMTEAQGRLVSKGDVDNVGLSGPVRGSSASSPSHHRNARSFPTHYHITIAVLSILIPHNHTKTQDPKNKNPQTQTHKSITQEPSPLTQSARLPGDVPLQGRLLGAQHRGPQQPPRRRRGHARAAHAPPARRRRPLADAQPRAPDPQRHRPRPLRRPQDGRPRGAKGERRFRMCFHFLLPSHASQVFPIFFDFAVYPIPILFLDSPFFCKSIS